MTSIYLFIYLFTFQGNFSAYHSVLRINRVSDCCESQSVDSCVAREIDHSVQPNLCVTSMMHISVLQVAGFERQVGTLRVLIFGNFLRCFVKK